MIMKSLRKLFKIKECNTYDIQSEEQLILYTSTINNDNKKITFLYKTN